MHAIANPGGLLLLISFGKITLQGAFLTLSPFALKY